MDNKLLIQDLAEAIAIKEGLTKKKSEAFIKALFETIEEGLLADKFVKIKGLGTFKIITVGERESVNINTGERFSIEGHEKVTFTPDTTLKDLVNRPFAHFQTVVINEDTNLEELESVDEEVDATSLEEDASDEDDMQETLDTESEQEETQTSPAPASDTMPDDIVEEEKEVVEREEVDEKVAAEEQISESTGLLENELPSASETAIETMSETMRETTSENDPQEIQPSMETEVETTDATTEPNSEEVPAEAQASEVIHNDPEVSEVTLSPQESDENQNQETGNTVENRTEEPLVTEEEHQESKPMSENTEKNSQPNVSEPIEHSDGESQQQIKYIIKDLENKRNTWKTISIILLSALLLLLSYFAGYFRWFCPCEVVNNPESNATGTCTTTLNEVPPVIKVASVQTEDSLALQPDTLLTKSEESRQESKVKSTAVTNKEQDINVEKTAPRKSTETQTPKKKEVDPESQYRQVAGGRYKIIGTIKKHQIQNGETIRTIAFDVYGSKGYAIYIITHNNLENPNLVETGTIIKLPKLERRKK